MVSKAFSHRSVAQSDPEVQSASVCLESSTIFSFRSECAQHWSEMRFLVISTKVCYNETTSERSAVDIVCGYKLCSSCCESVTASFLLTNHPAARDKEPSQSGSGLWLDKAQMLLEEIICWGIQ